MGMSAFRLLFRCILPTRRRRETTMKALTLLFSLVLVPFAGAQAKYTTFVLGPNAGQPPYTVTSINDSGQVLGWRVSNGEAFVISPGDVWTKNIIKTNGSIAMNNAAT